MQGPTKQIAVRVPLELEARLQQKADAENNYLSTIARRLLTKALNAEDEAASRVTRRRQR